MNKTIRMNFKVLTDWGDTIRVSISACDIKFDVENTICDELSKKKVCGVSHWSYADIAEIRLINSAVTRVKRKNLTKQMFVEVAFVGDVRNTTYIVDLHQTNKAIDEIGVELFGSKYQYKQIVVLSSSEFPQYLIR